ncbi:MAG: hypothetical protein ACLPWD_02535 [Methanobacterium sp.]
MKKVCSDCNTDNIYNAKYCENCGTEFSESTENNMHHEESGKNGNWRLINSLWIGFTFTLGFLNWISFLYVGIHVRKNKWIIYGLIYAIPIILAFLTIPKGPFPSKSLAMISILLIFIMGFISIIHALMIRKEYLIRLEAKPQFDQNRDYELRDKLKRRLRSDRYQRERRSITL